MTGEELRAIRKGLRWSQTTAADWLGVTLRTYQYYEHGETSRGTEPERVPQAVALAMLALQFNQHIVAVTADE